MADGKIIAISISEKKGQKKHNIESANLIVDHGMEGDAHAGNWHRQISLLGIASIEHMRAQGADVKPGDFAENITVQTDCVILAGNAVIPTIDAACRIAKEQQVPLLISGGIGHSTTFLYAAIAEHPRYHTIRTTGRAEAAILADIAHQFWHIPGEKIWVEDQSTNCGENARFSCALLRQATQTMGPSLWCKTLPCSAAPWRHLNASRVTTLRPHAGSVSPVLSPS